MHLYERKGLHGQILKIHIEHNNVEAALDTCRQFGPQDPNLWIQALQLIGNIEGKKVREEHIEEILQVNFKPKKILNFMHGLKSAILAIFQKGPGWLYYVSAALKNAL